MRRGTEAKKNATGARRRGLRLKTGDHELLIELLRSRLLLQKPLYIRLLTLRNPCCRKVVSPPITDPAKAAKGGNRKRHFSEFTPLFRLITVLKKLISSALCWLRFLQSLILAL